MARAEGASRSAGAAAAGALVRVGTAGRDLASSWRIRRRDRGFAAGPVYAATAFAARRLMRLFFRLEGIGAGKVPLDGPAILASNHASVLDPVAVNCLIPRRLCFLARDSLFRVPGLGALIRWLDALPIARDRGVPRAGLRLALRALELGRALLLFPEGSRSRDGRLGPLRRGVALMAKRSGVPVYPVWIAGSFEAWPRHRMLPRPGRIRVAFGDPIACRAEEGLDAFTERLRLALLALENALQERACRDENPK